MQDADARCIQQGEKDDQVYTVVAVGVQTEGILEVPHIRSIEDDIAVQDAVPSKVQLKLIMYSY